MCQEGLACGVAHVQATRCQRVEAAQREALARTQRAHLRIQRVAGVLGHREGGHKVRVVLGRKVVGVQQIRGVVGKQGRLILYSP